MQKRALNIGLNYTDGPYALPDCDIDAREIQERCVEAGYIAHLRLGKFSVADFVEEIERFKADVKKGDVTLISFSGHGTQWVNNDMGNEPEYYDLQEEGICFWNGQEIEVMPDDNFRRLIDQIPGSVFVFLDSCFSGGMERGASPRTWQKKCIPFNPAFGIIRPESIMSREAIRAAKTSKKYFLFASAENEVSWSTGDGGLFTNSFCQVYDVTTDKGRTITYLMRRCVTLCGQEQTPNFRCIGGNGQKRVF